MFDLMSIFRQQPNQLAAPAKPSGNMLSQPGTPGQIVRGPDGKNYQYAQTTGMDGYSGDNGWIQTSMSPKGGSGGGLMDKFKAFNASDQGQSLHDFFTGMAMGATPQQSLGMGAQMISQGRDKRKGKEQQNQTVEWLKGQGMDDSQAKLIASQPAVLADFLKQKMDPNSGLDAQYRQAQIDNMKSQIEQRNNPNARAQFGNTPIWGQDKDGKWHVMQPSSAGGLAMAPNPDGIDLVPPGVGQVNLGTSYGIRDRAGNIINNVPIDNAGAARDKTIGAQQGAQIAAAPTDIDNAQNALDAVASVRDDPNKGWGTGLTSLGNILPGSPGKDFQNKVEGLKSGSFLAGIQALRGLGSLSDAEGKAATSAINRMDVSTSETAFNAALADYEKIVRQGLARAQAHQQGQFPAATQSSTDAGADPLGIR